MPEETSQYLGMNCLIKCWTAMDENVGGHGQNDYTFHVGWI